jgi:hypothetical protein
MERTLDVSVDVPLVNVKTFDEENGMEESPLELGKHPSTSSQVQDNSKKKVTSNRKYRAFLKSKKD